MMRNVPQPSPIRRSVVRVGEQRRGRELLRSCSAIMKAVQEQNKKTKNTGICKRQSRCEALGEPARAGPLIL